MNTKSSNPNVWLARRNSPRTRSELVRVASFQRISNIQCERATKTESHARFGTFIYSTNGPLHGARGALYDLCNPSTRLCLSLMECL